MKKGVQNNNIKDIYKLNLDQILLNQYKGKIISFNKKKGKIIGVTNNKLIIILGKEKTVVNISYSDLGNIRQIKEILSIGYWFDNIRFIKNVIHTRDEGSINSLSKYTLEQVKKILRVVDINNEEIINNQYLQSEAIPKYRKELNYLLNYPDKYNIKNLIDILLEIHPDNITCIYSNIAPRYLSLTKSFKDMILYCGKETSLEVINSLLSLKNDRINLSDIESIILRVFNVHIPDYYINGKKQPKEQLDFSINDLTYYCKDINNVDKIKIKDILDGVFKKIIIEISGGSYQWIE